MKIYIDKLGRKDPVKDYETIRWFLNYQKRNYKEISSWKKMIARLYSRNLEALHDAEAFELIDFLESNCSERQIVGETLSDIKRSVTSEVRKQKSIEEARDLLNEVKMKQLLRFNSN